jgi:sugar (pentulose or hexulose) kinase
MKTVNLLAFDLGASGGRGLLGRFNGSTIEITPIHQFPNGPVTIAGHLYWDVPRFFTEIQDGMLKAASLGVGPITSTGIDTWGVDYGLLDAEGELLGLPYHYRDARTGGMFEEAFRRMSREEIFRRTGVAFQPFNTLFQLLSMRISKNDLLERAATLLFMPDLLSYFLTGEKLTEYTEASTGQILDVAAKTWSRDVVEAMGFPEKIFTRIQPPGTVRGSLLAHIADSTRLGRIPVVAVASHDTASAVVAVPARGDDHAYLSSGTWSLLGVETREPLVSEEALRWNFTNEGGFEGRFRLLRNVMGLWIVQECRRSWDLEGMKASYDDLVAMAQRARPFVAAIDPDDALFYSPGEMPQKVQEYCRRTRQEVPGEPGEIVRVALESLALKYRWVLEKLETVIGRPVGTLYIVGGGVRNSVLNQFTANALKRPVVTGYSEATAAGNLLVQAFALGELRSLADIREVARRSFPTVTFEPSEAGPWDAAYGRFLSLLEV